MQISRSVNIYWAYMKMQILKFYDMYVVACVDCDALFVADDVTAAVYRVISVICMSCFCTSSDLRSV